MDIDLGQQTKAKVKIGEHSYALRLPTVFEAEAFRERLDSKKNEADQLTAFTDLVETLGLPNDVLKSLDVRQFEKLAEGLLGLSKKK